MKKTFTLIIAFALSVGLSVPTFANFSDVDSSHPNATAIDWMYTNGVVEGYSDGTFKPNQSVNRVEFLKMLYATLNIDTNASNVGPSQFDGRFPDVDQAQWYWTYLRYALEAGTVDGYPDGTFKPNNTINYAEAAKIVANAYFDMDSWYSEDLFNNFDTCELDESKYRNDWFWHYLGYLDQNCIFPNELSEIETTSRPALNITRGQMAEMLYRAKAVKDNNTDYTDLEFVELNVAPDPLEENSGTQDDQQNDQDIQDAFEEDHDLIFDYPQDWEASEEGDSIILEDDQITVTIDFYQSDLTLQVWFDSVKRLAEDQILHEIDLVNEEMGSEFWTRDDVEVLVETGSTNNDDTYILQSRTNLKSSPEGPATTFDCYYLKNSDEIIEACGTVATDSETDQLLGQLEALVKEVELL